MAATTSKERALVLGGGGPVGVAWELGIAAGLLAGGVDLAQADFVVGTSAGSITGAMLKSGDDVHDLAATVGDIFDRNASGSGADQVPVEGLAKVMETMMRSAGSEDLSEEEVRAQIGAGALAATTISEDAFVDSLGSIFRGRIWPEGFACTAVDAVNGAFQIWDATSDVPLERAIASSCSVPYVYPPITIGDRRYIDGGMRSPLNADLAAGHEKVIVVSCMIMDLPPMFDDPRIARYFDAQKQSLGDLEAAGAAVELIAPDEEFLNLSGYGMSLMDFSKVRDAAESGVRLGKREADRLRAHW
jgi:NTE family protein